MTSGNRKFFDKTDGRSFAEATKNGYGYKNLVNCSTRSSRNHLSFIVDEEMLTKYAKAYVGVVKEPGKALTMKRVFHE